MKKIKLHIVVTEGKNECWVRCEEANLAQFFLTEDVSELLNYLPNLLNKNEKIT